jgi:hypothetical protein
LTYLRVVVAEDRLAYVAIGVAQQRVQVVARRVDRVVAVVDVLGAVVAAVDAIALPGRRRPVGEVELHRAGAAAVAVQAGTDAGCGGAAVVGLDRPDRGEDLPREAVLAGRRPVRGQVAGRDVAVGGGARIGLVAAAARIRVDSDTEQAGERREYQHQCRGEPCGDAERTRGGFDGAHDRLRRRRAA